MNVSSTSSRTALGRGSRIVIRRVVRQPMTERHPRSAPGSVATWPSVVQAFRTGRTDDSRYRRQNLPKVFEVLENLIAEHQSKVPLS